MTRTVTGVDLSLTAVGIARHQLGGTWYTTTIKPPARLTGIDRLVWLLNKVSEHCVATQLVAVEGPSYGSGTTGRQSGQHERAGLWWMVRHELWRWGIPVAVIPPATVKQFATGKGSADKDAMVLATARRFPDFEGDNNAADALWLAAMGADHLGAPLVDMPQANRAALGKVVWP